MEEAEEKRLIKEAKQNVARHATAWVENVPYHGKKLLQEHDRQLLRKAGSRSSGS